MARGRQPSPPEPEPIPEGSTVPVDAPEGFFREAITEEDRKPERSRKGGDDDLIHATSALDNDFCPREEWLMRSEGKRVYRGASGAQRIVWMLGRAAEHHVRQQLIAKFGQRAYGRWLCRCGATWTTGLAKPSYSCPTCGSGHTFYAEESVALGGVVGNADFVLLDDDDREVVFEIKSIQKSDFEALAAPLAEHVRQAKTYIYLRSEKGRAVDPRPRLIYVAKDFVTTGAYKEFRAAAANLDNPEGFFQLMMQEAEQALGDELPPKLPACSVTTSPRARRCSCVASCFLRGDTDG